MIYDKDWQPVDPATIDYELGYLIPATKVDEIKPAWDEIVIWDEERGLRRIEHHPAECSYEACQQYLLRTVDERIAYYQQLLAETDYIANKVSDAIILVETEALEEYREKYAEQLADRKVWRQKIDELREVNGDV